MMFSGDQASKKTSVLSGGERSRVLLGKILATPCNLLLLDEPTHHLDMESIEALIDALEDFEGAIVLVTHSELILRRLQLNKIIICHEGEQEHFQGTYDDFLEKKGWEEKGAGGSKGKKSGDSKENRKQRANSVAERSKALKPLDSGIAETEKLINDMEKQLPEMHAKLIKVSEQGKGSEIQQLTKEISVKQTAVDRLYEKLDQLSSEREKVVAKYDLEAQE